MRYERKPQTQVVFRHGRFHKQLSLWQATALIVSGTIGAGVLGIPYAIAKVGMGIGLVYLIGIGLLMMALNLMMGEIATHTQKELQMVGFARRYLGRAGELIMTVVMYVTLFGVMVIYIIGEGQTLSALIGGTPFFWSTVFYVLISALILGGMRTIKTVELFLSLGILAVVLLITLASTPHINGLQLTGLNFSYLFLPFGVLLFAYNGVTAVPEAHTLLMRRDGAFKKAIIAAGIISMIVYTLFALVVLGVTGSETTEIATIGLGERVPAVLFFGNLFALFAMGTSALLVGLSLRDSMRWDFRVPTWLSTAIVAIAPYLIFVLGSRQFIATMDIVGGVFMSFEALLILLMYWRTRLLRQRADAPGKLVSKSRFGLKHAPLVGGILVLVFVAGSVYTILQLFT